MTVKVKMKPIDHYSSERLVAYQDRNNRNRNLDMFHVFTAFLGVNDSSRCEVGM